MRISAVRCARTPILGNRLFQWRFTQAVHSLGAAKTATAQCWTLRKHKVLKAKFAATKGGRAAARRKGSRRNGQKTPCSDHCSAHGVYHLIKLSMTII